MNANQYEKVIFTDSIQKYYDSYLPPVSANNINAKEEAGYLMDRIHKFRNKVNEMRKVLFTQQKIPEQEQKYIKTWGKAFSAYFKIHEEIKQQDLDGGSMNIETRRYILNEEWLLDQLQKKQDDKKEAFKLINCHSYISIPFFGDLSSQWDLRFSSNNQYYQQNVLTVGEILKQICSIKDDIEILYFLFYIALLRRGILFLHKCVGTVQHHFNWALDKELCYCVLFGEDFNDQQVIVGAVMPERVPICTDNNQLKSFEYRQYIILTELLDINNFKGMSHNYTVHKDLLVKDQDKHNCFKYEMINLRKDAPLNELYISVQFKHLFSGDVISYTITPLKICKWMIKEPSVKNFKYDQEKRRWIQFVFEEKVIVNKQDPNKFADSQILDKFDDVKQTEKLSEILNFMPTLNIKLSTLQQTVVKSNQNLLCLGRSGTGKTTTSVLRLFSQEILYLILNKQNKLNQEYQKIVYQIGQEEANKFKKNVTLEAFDLSQNTGTKIVFITASPVLTNEVMRFYGNIKKALQSHLKVKEGKREKKRLQQIEEEAKKSNVNFEEVKIIDNTKEDDDLIETIEDQEKKDLLEFIKKEESLLLEDQKLEDQLEIPNSYNSLQPHHFPLFVTVKKLILMMDACLSFSFFSRDNQNRIIGLDQNLGWHNETKGVMMINHYYKENIDYDEQLAKFGKEILEMDCQVDIQQEEDDNNTNNFHISEENQKKAYQDDSEKYRYQNVFGHNRVNEKYILERQQLSFEVDYDMFESKFWPKIAQRKNFKKFSSTMVWTEIYSVIKGGLNSSSYYQGYLPKNVYINHDASEFLSLHEKKTVYYIFLEYEKWKSQMNAYDFMDLITHVQKRLWYGESLRRMKMDFLMVDEVQDLTPKTIRLLLQLTNHNVFFAGDTAQTIAKGVGARFLDLRHIFSNLDCEVPKIVQLTKNYRSHGRILDLANSVVDLIELFFPKTIDKLQKEESELNGMMPLVIMPLDNNSLKSLFMGTSMSSQNEGQFQSPPPAQFGCNQVLIVRDQQAKESIPDIFKNMLCLSVYEAKGLEFDDVILYNFFHLGDVSKSQWKLLNDVVYSTVKKVKYSDELLIQDFDALDVEMFAKFMKEIKDSEKQAEEEQDYVEDVQLGVKRDRDEVYKKFSMLCVELKFLYVAITRPKRRLIIYDDVADGRKPLQNYWTKLGIVEVITKDMVQQPQLLKEEFRKIFEAGSLCKDRSTQEEWRLQGIKLFKKKYYDAAVKCFQFSMDDDLVKRCLAYKDADEGSNLLSEADSKAWRARTLKHLLKADKKRLVKESKQIRNRSKEHFESAGRLFESIQMLKHSASCFYTAKNYIKAAEIFENLGQFGQAAECLMIENQLQKAAKLYEKANLVSLAIDCYESAGEWEQLLHCLHRNKEFFKVEERESLVNKYVPVALNSLYKLYSQDQGDDGEVEELDEENKGKLQEMKIKLKYQKKVNVIEEEANEEDDEDMSSSDEEEQKVVEVNDNQGEGDDKGEDGDKNLNTDEQQIDTCVKEDKPQTVQIDQNELIEIDEDEELPDILDEVFQLKKIKSQKEEEAQQLILLKQKSSEDQSFDIISEDKQILVQKDFKLDDQTEKLLVLEEDEKKEEQVLEMKDDFEHLSQYDPDDEFLRSNKSVSIIDSILSKKVISHTSEFSIITSKNHGKNSQSVISLSSKKSKNMIAFVESNRDIYAEDVITQKIIYYVSLFSEEVSVHLSKLRSKKVLFSNKSTDDLEVKEKQQVADVDDFIIDLDDVDHDFINLILDALEYYELFRLCLMICNRYQMSDRLGRYLVSVCSKYSNLHLHRFTIDLLKNTNFNLVWREKQRQSSILAHEAIHNVFALINPKFLALKDFNDTKLVKENSLGIETYRMMFDLGFWKKLVYILPGKTSLQICNLFFDRDNFEMLIKLLDVKKPEDQKIIQIWHNQVILRSYQSFVLGKVQDIQFRENSNKVFEEIISEYSEEEDPEIKELIANCIYITEMLLKIEEKIVVKNDKFGLENQLKINQQTIQKRQDQALNIQEIIKYYVVNAEVKNFTSYFIAFQFAMAPLSIYNDQLQRNVRENFDKETLQVLVNIYLRTLKALNMEMPQKYQDECSTLLQALYSVFLISPLTSDCLSQQFKDDEISIESICKQYKDNYLIVHRNSPLTKELINIQQCLNIKIQNENLGNLILDLRPKYFRVQNFKIAVNNLQNEFINNQKKVREEIQLMILDMDCQFLLVPKAWVTKLLAMQIGQLSISFSNTLKTKMQSQIYEEENIMPHYEEPTIEGLIQLKSIEIQIMEKVNRQLKDTVFIHQKYLDSLRMTQQQLLEQIRYKEDYADLVTRYWKQFNIPILNFNHISQNITFHSRFPFEYISSHLQLMFEMGIMHDKEKQNILGGMNDLLKEAFNQFELTFIPSSEIKIQNDDCENGVQVYRLQQLLKSLQYFILMNKYEYMIELIKYKRKSLKKQIQKQNKQNQQIPQKKQQNQQENNLTEIDTLLKKFMIAVDIHVLLKCGSWSLAADSIYSFLNTFYQLLTFEEKAKILQNAFYLVMIAKFGKVYLPDYSIKYLDIGFNLETYYQFGSEADKKQHKYTAYQGDERMLIDISISDKNVEKTDSDKFYHESLYWTNKLLADLNKDESSSAQKKTYKKLYNILMSVAINDTKKSQKVYDFLIKGFECFTNSPFDDYFPQVEQTQKGINQVYTDFKDTQDEYKWEFFVSSKSQYGQFIAYIDASNSQTKQAQTQINTITDKATIKEYKVLASHLYLSMKLRRLFKQKKHIFKTKSVIKNNFNFEYRELLNSLGIQKILKLYEQLPVQKVIDMIIVLCKKQILLRQMIVSKYASSSQDLHFIISKAIELDLLSSHFIEQIKTFLKEKGQIFQEYVVEIGEIEQINTFSNKQEQQKQSQNEEKKNNKDEVSQIISETNKAVKIVTQELTIWMDKKAEPNLMEVERKSKKFKLRWEALSTFEKRQRILTLRQKKQIIESSK